MKRFLSLSPNSNKIDKRSKSVSTLSTTSSISESSDITVMDSSPCSVHDLPTVLAKLHSPKKVNVEELSKLVISMAKVISSLQEQNNALISQVSLMKNEFSELKKTIENGPANKKTFAEILTKSLAAPSAQVSIMQAAKLAQNSDDRTCSVIIRNSQVSTDPSNDEEFGRKIATECGAQDSCSVFRIPLKSDLPPLLKLRFKTKEDASLVLNKFESIKKRINGCLTSTIRPDLSKPELIKYRNSWKEAIRRNDESGQRIWTVRNLEVVKIAYQPNATPWPWTVRTKQNLSQ